MLQLTEGLLSQSSLEQRVEYAVDTYLQPLAIFTQTGRKDLCHAAQTFFNKLVIADRYSPDSRLNSKVTLVKSSQHVHSLSKDYGLSEVCIYKET